MRQDLATVVQYDQIAAEYAPVVQVAGLRTAIIDICRNDAATPDQLRKMLIHQLQATLPKSVPASIRGNLSPQAPADMVATTEAKVRSAVFETAHQSPELRAVVSKDRVGREQTEFFGQKRSWMTAYSKPPQLMKSINGQPVRLPVIV
ncbi:hypothetical protein AWB69_05971 [Caballeronia udeis]|uniref:Uncharacterized protein n=1 Tax=Caballeronia udeis TaxID=1232866 RepID=A0A158IGF7_9BURK|nr:hypothetical protein [Caballeronia udeis]SAL55626.1 hypothetical protein AWB69_05971 [Caballeronia udeis]